MSSKGGKGYNYRQEYFKKNKGILNSGIFICPYCGLPVKGKNAHVDHIIPKSKSETLFNRQYNLIVSHPKCNQSKSDKIDFRVAQGYTAKIFGNVIGGTFNAAINLISMPLRFVPGLSRNVFNIFGGIVGWAFKLIFQVISSTFAMIFSLLFQPIILIIMIGVLFIIFNR